VAMKLGEWLWEETRRNGGRAAASALGLAAVVGVGASFLRWKTLRDRELRRPFSIRDLAAGEEVADPQGELTRIVEWLQDTIVCPLDARLPGCPFQHDLLAFPFTPMVVVIGNHSAGKSTFINHLLGISVQETGVAPTDDGFTVLQRHATANEVEDGPTLLSCPENRPFKELQRFGQPFWGHFRRKRLVLPQSSPMPMGLQIVDTPGMIDMPVKVGQEGIMTGGRGYNFLEVVRWFAKRADLILLLFDPDRPGTTGESLDVLTRSLAGLDHKFVIILNKVDQLDSSVDFARAYGTLGWALSKVIPRKDIPLIYTMYNAGIETGEREHKLPLEAFRKKREEVVAEVMRAKARHWDNIITSTEDTLRQLEMVSTVTQAVRERVRSQVHYVEACGVGALGLPGVLAAWLFREKFVGPRWVPSTFWLAYTAVCYGAFHFLREYTKQFERLQIADLDTYFEEAYGWHFIHADSEDLRGRWTTVRHRVVNILRAASSITALPRITPWEISRINACLEKDVWYLRLLAKLLRGGPEAMVFSPKLAP